MNKKLILGLSLTTITATVAGFIIYKKRKRNYIFTSDLTEEIPTETKVTLEDDHYIQDVFILRLNSAALVHLENDILRLASNVDDATHFVLESNIDKNRYCVKLAQIDELDFYERKVIKTWSPKHDAWDFLAMPVLRDHEDKDETSHVFNIDIRHADTILGCWGYAYIDDLGYYISHMAYDGDKQMIVTFTKYTGNFDEAPVIHERGSNRVRVEDMIDAEEPEGNYVDYDESKNIADIAREEMKEKLIREGFTPEEADADIDAAQASGKLTIYGDHIDASGAYPIHPVAISRVDGFEHNDDITINASMTPEDEYVHPACVEEESGELVVILTNASVILLKDVVFFKLYSNDVVYRYKDSEKLDNYDGKGGFAFRVTAFEA